jgi:2-keto-3-deoxy-L-rhamnonate aldolase RhmA
MREVCQGQERLVRQMELWESVDEVDEMDEVDGVDGVAPRDSAVG